MRNPFKRLNYWFQTALYSALFLAVLIFVFVLAAPFNQIFDFSPEKKFSFSDKTQAIFEEVRNEKIELIGFFQNDDPVIHDAESLFSSFKRYLPKLTFSHYDPEKDPDQARAYGIHEYGVILIKMGARQTVVMAIDEEGVRQALERLTTKKRPVILFIEGHREASPADTGALGYSFLKDSLINSAYVVKQGFIDSPSFKEADLLILAYPKKDFTPEEINSLRSFTSKKSAIFMVDPEEESIFPVFQEFLLEYGVELGNTVILDRTSRIYGADDLIPVVNDFTNHEIVKGFDLPIFFPLARSLEMKDTPEAEIWEKDYLVFSGPESWGETDYGTLEEGNYSFDKTTDVPGPLPLAVALERKTEPKNRVLIFGDSDFVNNTNFNAGGNRLLFLNTIAWTLHEKLLFGEREPAPDSKPWVMPSGKKMKIFFALILIPGALCFFILGSLFVFRRLMT